MGRNDHRNSDGPTSQLRTSNGEIDRYNYVNRDVYSSSGKKRSQHSRPRKPKHTGRNVAIAMLCLVLVAAIFGFGYFKIMANRLNREDVNTSKYVQQPSSAPTHDVISDNKITNILLIGADQMDKGTQRSDSMMLISIDNNTKKLRMVSFLRDLYVQIPTLGKNKLNAAFSKDGAGLTMQTLENNFRINIDKYVMTDFNNFATIIDKLGGIDVVMTKEEAAYMNKIKHSNLTSGKNHLRGTLALYYSRMRYLDSDFGRTGRQRQVITAMLTKMKTLNLAELTSLMYDNLHLVTTNLTDSDLAYLCSIGLNVAKYDTGTMCVPAKGTYQDKPVDGVGAVLDPDLEANCTKLWAFLYGKDANDSSVTLSSAAN